MKTRTLAIAILLIVFLTQLMVVRANPFLKFNQTLTIESPEYTRYYARDNITTITHHTATVPLTVMANRYDHEVANMLYSLDNGPNTTLSFCQYPKEGYYVGMENLENLSDGIHTLNVYAIDINGNETSTFTLFSVDAKGYNDSTTSLITNLFIAAIVLVLVVVVSFIIYRKKKPASKQSLLKNYSVVVQNHNNKSKQTIELRAPNII